MTKVQLVNALASKLDVTKKLAGSFINAILDEITLELKRGKNVAIPGFGTFGVKDRAERMGRNPQTGQVIRIAAARVPFFRAGSQLKSSVNSKGGQKSSAKGRK